MGRASSFREAPEAGISTPLAEPKPTAAAHGMTEQEQREREAPQSCSTALHAPDFQRDGQVGRSARPPPPKESLTFSEGHWTFGRLNNNHAT